MHTNHHDFKNADEMFSSHDHKHHVHKPFAGRGLFLTIMLAGLLATVVLVKNGNFDVRNMASVNKVDVSLAPSTLTVSPNQSFTALVNVIPNGHEVTSLDIKFMTNNVTITDITHINTTATPPVPYSNLNNVLPENPADPNRYILAVTCTTTCPTLNQTGTLLKISGTAGSSGMGSINFDTTNTLAASINNGNTNVIGDLTGITITIAGPTPTPVPSGPATSPTPPPGNKKPNFTTGANLGSVTKNQAMNKAIVATDPEGNTMTMTVTSGTLPPGVTLNSCQQSGGTLTCQLSGTPTQSGSFTIGITAKDVWNASNSRDFKLRVQ